MVSSLLVEALNDPTRVLREIYDPSKEIDTFPSTVSGHFSKIFESFDAFQEVRVFRSTLTPFHDLIPYLDFPFGCDAPPGVAFS
jgi:hypothetical protein